MCFGLAQPSHCVAADHPARFLLYFCCSKGNPRRPEKTNHDPVQLSCSSPVIDSFFYLFSQYLCVCFVCLCACNSYIVKKFSWERCHTLPTKGERKKSESNVNSYSNGERGKETLATVCRPLRAHSSPLPRLFRLVSGECVSISHMPLSYAHVRFRFLTSWVSYLHVFFVFFWTDLVFFFVKLQSV